MSRAIDRGLPCLSWKITQNESVSFCPKYTDRRYKICLSIFHFHTLVFVTCCGSTYEKKDEKFGHGFVFKEVESILKDKCILCQAFPINLVLPDDKKEDTDAFMKTHLNDENFNGEIQERFEDFIKKITDTNK